MKFLCKVTLLAVVINMSGSADVTSTIFSTESTMTPEVLDMDMRSRVRAELKALKPRPLFDNISGKMHKLRAKLFDGYDKLILPDNLTVKFGMALIEAELDEVHHTLEADVRFRYIWTDPRLQWNTNETGIDVIRLDSGEIWKPDISLYNSGKLPDPVNCGSANALIYATGDILWVPPCHVSAACNMTLKQYPYREQKCFMKFGSWTFDGWSMDLQFYKNTTNVDLADFQDTSDWKVTSNIAFREEKFYDCCPQPYPALYFNLGLKRKTEVTDN